MDWNSKVNYLVFHWRHEYLLSSVPILFIQREIGWSICSCFNPKCMYSIQSEFLDQISRVSFAVFNFQRKKKTLLAFHNINHKKVWLYWIKKIACIVRKMHWHKRNKRLCRKQEVHLFTPHSLAERCIYWHCTCSIRVALAWLTSSRNCGSSVGWSDLVSKARPLSANDVPRHVICCLVIKSTNPINPFPEPTGSWRRS